MTIPATPRKAGPFLGTGAQTVFPFAFKVFSADDVTVTVADDAGVETELSSADYTVTLNVNQDTSPGGTVTYPRSGAALPVNSRLVITSGVDLDQPLDLPSGGNFSPLALENELDRIVMQIQQLAEQWTRALRVSVTSSGVVPAFPPPVANKLIAWNSGGTALTNADIADLSQQFVYADWRYETFTGDGVTRQFLLAGNPSTIANTDTSIDGLSQVPVDDFALDGNIVTFAVPPGVGAQILVRYGRTLSQSGGLQTITKQVATAGQTVFTLGDSYPSNQSAIAVYVNGLRMEGAAVDFTETNDTTITFTSPLAAGDSVIFVVGTEVTGSGPGVVSLATGNNVGAGAGLLFRDVTDDGIDRKLNIKTIAAGNGVTVTNGADTVQLAVNVGAGLSFDGSGKLVASTAAGVLNVKAAPFNALGDGVTNDTAAIQAALNYAAANSLSLRFPAGTYIATGLTFTATATGHVCIVGDGSGNTLIKAPPGSTAPVFKLGVGGPSLGPNQMLFQGLSFKGNYPGSYQASAAAYTQHTFLVDTANHILFDDCRFYNGVSGLTVRNGVITHLHRCGAWYNEIGFYVATPGIASAGTTTFLDKTDAKNNHRWGVYFDDGRMLTMSLCTVEGNGGNGPSSTGGVYVGEYTGAENGPGFNAIGAVIDTTWFEANAGSAQVYLRSGSNTMRDCNFTNVPTSSVILVDGGRYFLDRLRFENNKTYHIYEFAAANVLAGNSITNCFVGAATNTPANVLYDPAKTSINFSSVSATVVSGANVGAGAGLVYRDAASGSGTRTLNFKSLQASTGVSLTNNADTVSLAVAPATGAVIGGVRPGAGLSVDGAGVLTSAAAVGGWANAVLDAGWTTFTTHTVRYRREGDVVRLSGAMQYSSSTMTEVPVFTLPAGFRPVLAGYAALAAAGGGNTHATLSVNDSTGVVTVTATNAVVFLDGITFPTT